MLIFFRAGFTHRRGYVSGGHVGEGLAARSPDRRLSDPRGVPGNPERDLKLVCGARKGAIRVSSSRERETFGEQPKNTKISPKKSPARERIVEARTAPRARPGAQPGAHAGLRINIFLVVLEDEERRVVFTPRSLGITGRLSRGAAHRSAHLDHHPVLRGDVRGRDGDRGGTLQRLHALLSHEVLHVRVTRRLKHRPGLIVVEVERVPPCRLQFVICRHSQHRSSHVTQSGASQKTPSSREDERERETGGSNRRFKPVQTVKIRIKAGGPLVEISP